MSDAAPTPLKADKAASGWLTALRGHPAHHGAALALFSLAAAALLVNADRLTRGEIEKRAAEDLAALLSQVLPATAGESTSPIEVDDAAFGSVDVYRAIEKGAVAGAAFEVVATGGYAGDIRLIMGVDAEGRIIGVRVLSHAETPGLGDKIERAKSDWVLAFNGRSLGDPAPERWRVKKDGGVFDQFSGATITPRAVVAGVREGLDFAARHRDALFAPPEAEAGQPEEREI